MATVGFLCQTKEGRKKIPYLASTQVGLRKEHDFKENPYLLRLKIYLLYVIFWYISEMPIRLKFLPRRLVPIYLRDLLGTDALFRMQQKEILKAVEIVKKAMNCLFVNGRLNELRRTRLNSILRVLKKPYLLNMLVYIPARNPRCAIERQTFKRFINQFVPIYLKLLRFLFILLLFSCSQVYSSEV